MERLTGERMGALFPVLALTGCALSMAAPTSLPVTGSHSVGPTSSLQIGGPAESGTASLGIRSVAGSAFFSDPWDRYIDPHRRLVKRAG